MLNVPFSMVIYFMLFSLVLPVLSIFNFAVSNQTLANYDGFGYFKAYLFLSLIFILFTENIDLTRTLSVILTLLSMAMIAILFVVKYKIVDGLAVWDFGEQYGMLGGSMRSYGGYDYLTVDIYTSPLLVIPIAYFTYQFMKKKGFAKMGAMFILFVNVFAMFIVGTRSSIMLCVLTPLATWFTYTKKKLFVISILFVFLIIVSVLIKDVLLDALSMKESSNALKISFLNDYSVVFESLKNLLVGQGLGARFYVAGRGQYLSIVELTYVELIRNYGLIFSVFYFVMLAYPFIRYKAYYSARYLLVAYASYLLIGALNPLIFSSTGMLILSIVLCKAFKSAPLEKEAPNSNQLPVRC
ncbi:MAG: hypothetical protein ABIE74_12200 [Pseudomonadota bacterium]